MNVLNDLIYFTYIGGDEEQVIREMYKADPQVFTSHLNQLFDIEFRNKIAELVGLPLIADPDGTQEEIYEIFTEIAHHLHFLMSKAGHEFWHTRGVTEEQIVKFQLGDNWMWLPREDGTFPFEYDSSFFSTLAKTYRVDLVKNIFRAMYDMINTAIRLYGNGHAVCTPSFDSNHKCRGLVFRVINFAPNTAQFKNMYKFYNPFSWSYIFNYKTFEENDELIMVEGVFDALALDRLGYKNVISPSMVRLSPYHTKVLKDKKLHVLFDRDRGGLEGLKFIKDHFENQDNLVTLALCPTARDLDEMSTEEVQDFMDHISDYDVRNMTSKPVRKHKVGKHE